MIYDFGSYRRRSRRLECRSPPPLRIQRQQIVPISSPPSLALSRALMSTHPIRRCTMGCKTPNIHLCDSTACVHTLCAGTFNGSRKSALTELGSDGTDFTEKQRAPGQATAHIKYIRRIPHLCPLSAPVIVS